MSQAERRFATFNCENQLGGQSPFRGLDASLTLLFSYHGKAREDNSSITFI
jgi:hypothetical protein